jgi:negative regulator of sigma E activity
MDEFFARNRLSAYIDGELSDAEMAEVARAIEEQPEVREAYEELLAAVELLRRHGPVQAPAGFHAGVMRRVEDLPAGRAWLARLLGPLGRYPAQGLGVAVVAAAVLLLVFRGPTLVDPTDEASELGPAAVDREAAVPGPEATSQPEDEPGAADEQAEVQQAPAEPSSPSKEELLAEEIASKRGTSPSTSPKSSGSSSKKGVPIEELLEKEQGTYIPEWDKESSGATVHLAGPEGDDPAASGDSLATSPFAYRLTPDAPDALRKLVALAEKLGGGVYDSDGQPVDPYILTVERNYARVMLQIPASSLHSVEPYLRRLGGVVQVRAEQDRLYRADAVQVAIEVQYQP